MKIGMIFSLLIFVGCAQVHSGNMAFQVDKSGKPIRGIHGEKHSTNGLIISGKENLELSSRNFGVIDFTFENITDKWIRINNIRVYFKNKKANENIVFTSGKDLSLWYKATERKLILEDYNRQMALSLLAGVGAGLAIGSDNKNIQDIGTAMILTSGISLSIEAINKQLNRIQTANVFPEDHLYSGDFFVPPGLFTRRWILLNSTNHDKIGYLSQIYIDYQVESGSRKTIKLPFRARGNIVPAEWQSDVKPKPKVQRGYK